MIASIIVGVSCGGSRFYARLRGALPLGDQRRLLLGNELAVAVDPNVLCPVAVCDGDFVLDAGAFTLHFSIDGLTARLALRRSKRLLQGRPGILEVGGLEPREEPLDGLVVR